jgi:cell division septation protein DedD
MSDQSFHAIQLSRKQLVFLFMAAVIVAVSVFLLGVSFGRGVREISADAAAQPKGTESLPGTVPAPTEVKPTDLTYHDALQGRGQPAGDAARGAPAPASAAPPATVPASTANPPAAADQATAKPTATAPPPSATPPPNVPPSAPARTPPPQTTQPAARSGAPPAASTLPAPAATGTWLQTGAFSTLELAQASVAKLKGLKYPASVRTEPPGTSARFKVVVGPYASADVAKVRSQLQKDGFDSIPKG